jgi:hypothetical protein
MATQQADTTPDSSETRIGVVIPFTPLRPPDNRLSMRDRITLLEWGGHAGDAGIARITVEDWETGEDPGVVGDFAMIYRQDYEWATWMLARSSRRYSVWETAYFRTLGVFDTLEHALIFIAAEAATLKSLFTPSGQPRRPKRQRRGSRASVADATCEECAAG